jgi:hypothetical protein
MSNRRNFLELKANMGALTDAERAELERMRADRSVTYITPQGVVVSALRPYSLDEWKALRGKVNDEARERYRQWREEEEKAKRKTE